jgi:pheromone shutdown-related protein TraB
MIIIVGTSHIARQSVRDIHHSFLQHSPDIIAVELDQGRLQGLLSHEESSLPLSLIKHIGLTGYLFAAIGRSLQQKLGSIVNMQPGSEMLAAVALAQKHQKTLALIDRDILITLRRLSQEFTRKEKFRLFFDILSSPFSKRFRIDISRVPEHEMVIPLLAFLRQRYAGIYRALIDERDLFMAKQLFSLQEAHPHATILAVVGLGHKQGMEHYFAQITKNRTRSIDQQNAKL